MIKAILLAAGQSKRIKSENKLTKLYKKQPLLNHSLKALHKSKVNKVIIVLGHQQKEVKKIIKKNIALILNEKKLLISCLEKLDFVEKIHESDANFLLVKVDNADLRYDQLLKKGVVVRNRSNQPLCQNCLRITIGTKNDNNSLIKTLNEL